MKKFITKKRKDGSKYRVPLTPRKNPIRTKVVRKMAVSLTPKEQQEIVERFAETLYEDSGLSHELASLDSRHLLEEEVSIFLKEKYGTASESDVQRETYRIFGPKEEADQVVAEYLQGFMEAMLEDAFGKKVDVKIKVARSEK